MFNSLKKNQNDETQGFLDKRNYIGKHVYQTKIMSHKIWKWIEWKINKMNEEHHLGGPCMGHIAHPAINN